MIEHHRKTYLPGMGHDRLLFLYDPFCKLLGVESYHRPLVDQADVRPRQRVLEIGCGTGNLLLLVKRLHPAADVVGLDPDPKALARARRKAERAALAVRLDRGFVEEMPYPDASFDKVFSAFMLHHLDPEVKEQALRDVRRVLKPGGSLHLLDTGGAQAPSHGFVARMSRRNERLQDSIGDRVPALMREAGFADATEVGHRAARVVGSITYYHATVAQAAPHGLQEKDRT